MIPKTFNRGAEASATRPHHPERKKNPLFRMIEGTRWGSAIGHIMLLTPVLPFTRLWDLEKLVNLQLYCKWGF